jgi:hypothetical protein
LAQLFKTSRFLALFIAIVACGCLSDDLTSNGPDTGFIQGKVMMNGQPVAGVTLYVEGYSWMTNVISDETGDFTIKGIPLGAQTLVAEKTGVDGSFSRYTGNVSVISQTELGTITLPNPAGFYPIITVAETYDNRDIEIKWTSSNISDFKEYRIYRANEPEVDEISAELIYTSSSAGDTVFIDQLPQSARVFYRVFIYNSQTVVAASNVLALELEPIDWGTIANMTDFTIRELPHDEQPYYHQPLVSLAVNYLADADGIIMFKYDDQMYYHPIQLIQKTLSFIDSYIQSNNQQYLARAEQFTSKLMELSMDADGATYFYYPFGFRLHGYSTDLLEAPWHSGMAQGQALSVFVRLYQITGKPEYLTTAEKIFKTFSQLRDKEKPGTPWVTEIDKDGYLWIEEYPDEISNNELNGFIFAIYGLYDFYLLKKDSQSKKILQASMTTIRHYLPQWRNPGGISNYCLKHKVQNAKYHQVHIEQLHMLYKFTGEEYFQLMSELFAYDHS